MRKKYQSQIRYETNNPTITFRVKLKEKDKIENMAHHSGKSISELVRNALLGLEKDFTHTINIYYAAGKEEGKKIGNQEGDEKGYERGKNEWAIWVPCWKCNYRYKLYIKPNSTDHQQVIDELRGRLSHVICPSE
jgi:flagellar biosynthesis/type III secretory pathway protein FliH